MLTNLEKNIGNKMVAGLWTPLQRHECMVEIWRRSLTQARMRASRQNRTWYQQINTAPTMTWRWQNQHRWLLAWNKLKCIRILSWYRNRKLTCETELFYFWQIDAAPKDLSCWVHTLTVHVKQVQHVLLLM